VFACPAKNNFLDFWHQLLHMCEGPKFATFVGIKHLSPGLVVVGDDSCLRGRGFDSWCSILDGRDIFSH